MNNLVEIGEAIKRSNQVLLCGHVMPDGDCLGSVLALGLTLERLGKKVIMGGPDPIPEIYHFLPGQDRFIVGKPPEYEYDTFIVLDCSVPERLGQGYQDFLNRDLVLINIDHHKGSQPFGDYQYIDPKAAAVGEIILDLLDLMRVQITIEAAINLYTAIITDTGSFRYDNTTPGTHRRVASLLEMGIPAADIHVHLYEEKPMAALKVLGAALDTLTTSACGRVCWMTITREILNKAGAIDEHTDGLINYARSIKGVEVGLLFHEISKDLYKISFRSKNSVDVNKLAASFGGGGHMRAAGCVLQGDLKTIQEQIITAAILAAGGTGH
ncbi:MAG TPA: bifunctional oligoribonuclease/PAP phosphatase NrnA [Bacillota bacterium]|nr:bifunctional oligoribonuclease/PAP phosphatase NrnA [Peptococcaceae bacterium MAG4]NLW38290.1 bifunctional oligoribonuclease/PAP phosphatase NrnA [Peptococcaceae bacterium]HPU35962.1 bifunctional oligoribonuclease/PAP phosphatase NrnA [Bacillota bacterium]HPZ44351.1 bifunctional oligoribonuclease/PAP phosphatase NrnA [Bacillota bacterium]HQD77001.1 bifunctional oligoribonuclease/PAP phosphatase NrnA [Bacillota bacterium]